jgi:hypothetical protein
MQACAAGYSLTNLQLVFSLYSLGTDRTENIASNSPPAVARVYVPADTYSSNRY